MVTRRLQAERRIGSVRRPKNGVLPTVLRNQPDIHRGWFWERSTASFSVSSQISLESVRPHDARVPWWSPPVVRWVILASASSSIRAVCPNKERRRNWIITGRFGCLFILLISMLPFEPKQCSQEHRSGYYIYDNLRITDNWLYSTFQMSSEITLL